MYFAHNIVTIDAPANCTDGTIRLYGGSTEYDGILQICNDEVWGTVCYNSHWNNVDTNVVCNELGYTVYSNNDDVYVFSITIIIGNYHTGVITNEKYPIIYSGFNCKGNEAKLSSCTYTLSSNIRLCTDIAVSIVCSG